MSQNFWKKAPEPTFSGLFEIVSYDHRRGFGFVRTIGQIASYIHTGDIPGDIQLLRKVVKLANIQHLHPGDVIEAEITADGSRPRVTSIISHETGPNAATAVITVRVKTYCPENGWGFLRGVDGDIFFRRAVIEDPLNEAQLVAGLYVRAGITKTNRGWRAVWVGSERPAQKNSQGVSENAIVKDEIAAHPKPSPSASIAPLAPLTPKRTS